MQKKKFKVYGADWCGACLWVKYILDNLKVEFEYIDIEKDNAASNYVIELNQGLRSIPVLVFPSGKVLVEPNSEEIYKQLDAENLIQKNTSIP